MFTGILKNMGQNIGPPVAVYENARSIRRTFQAFLRASRDQNIDPPVAIIENLRTGRTKTLLPAHIDDINRMYRTPVFHLLLIGISRMKRS